MKVAYITGPYTAPTDTLQSINIICAKMVASVAHMAGYAVICPHTNFHFADGTCEGAIMDACLELVRRSDILILCRGWERSKGSIKEVNEARKSGIKIIYPGHAIPRVTQ